MKAILTTALLCMLLAGCSYSNHTSSETPPRPQIGALCIEVYTMGGEQLKQVIAEIYLDGKLIGVTNRFVLDRVAVGDRIVRVIAPGYKPYEKTITVLGNIRQELYVPMEKQ